MTKGKLFPLKIAIDGQGAVKESVHKHTNGEQTKIKVVFGLDSELRILEPTVLDEGVHTDSNYVASKYGLNVQDFLVKCKREGTPIYYALNSLTYLCIQTVIQERGKIVKNSISLYIPIEIVKKNLKCNDVSVVFPLQNRQALAKSYLNYTMSRV